MAVFLVLLPLKYPPKPIAPRLVKLLCLPQERLWPSSCSESDGDQVWFLRRRVQSLDRIYSPAEAGQGQKEVHTKMENWPGSCGGLKLLISDGKDAGHTVYGLPDQLGSSGRVKWTEDHWCFQHSGRISGDLSNHWSGFISLWCLLFLCGDILLKALCEIILCNAEVIN